MLKLRLESVEDLLRRILKELNASGIKCDAFSAGFATDSGFYIHLPGSDDWMRGKEGVFLRLPELIRLEILFRRF